MKRIIRLTESDLTRIVRRVIKENEYEEYDQDMGDYSELAPSYDSDRKFMGMVKPSGDMEMYEDEDEDDYKDRSMYSPYYGDDEDFEEDEEWGQTDMGEEELQDLIEEARDFLENECGYDLHDINLMGEEDIVDALYDEGNDNLANNIESLMEKEGFYNADEDEPYDSIGGHSVNDLKKAFAKTKGRDEELGEGWDDFTQKKRYPEDYKPEKYERIPRDYFKSPRRLDPEGTIGMPRKEKPFDDYEDFDDEEFV